MGTIETGSLVKHKVLGVGKVVAVEADALHVFFPDSDKRFAAKLRLPAAQALLRTDGFERSSWLEGLTAFELDPSCGRYGLASTWITHDQATDQFLAIFPAGFADPAYVGPGEGKEQRASRWRAAHEAFLRELGNGEAARLLGEGDVAALVKRALKVEKLVAGLHPPADASALKEALADEAPARTFFSALADLLSVPSPGRARFDVLFAAARGLPVEPPQQWLVATLFPFLASPERHVLMRPRATCEAAERLGCDLRYEPTPCWTTYAALRALSTQLLERLQPHGAKDFIDVESFLHVIAARKRPPARADGAASTSKPRGGTREARPRTTSRSRS
jgi:hypothetical protein